MTPNKFKIMLLISFFWLLSCKSSLTGEFNSKAPLDEELENDQAEPSTTDIQSLDTNISDSDNNTLGNSVNRKSKLSSFSVVYLSNSEVQLNWASTEIGSLKVKIAFAPDFLPSEDCSNGAIVEPSDPLSRDFKLSSLDENASYQFRICVEGDTGEMLKVEFVVPVYCQFGNHLTNAPFVNSGEDGIDGLSEKNSFSIYSAEQMNQIGIDPTLWDELFTLKQDISLRRNTGTQFNITGNMSTSFS